MRKQGLRWKLMPAISLIGCHFTSTEFACILTVWRQCEATLKAISPRPPQTWGRDQQAPIVLRHNEEVGINTHHLYLILFLSLKHERCLNSFLHCLSLRRMSFDRTIFSTDLHTMRSKASTFKLQYHAWIQYLSFSFRSPSSCPLYLSFNNVF
jgi:hypothetical protein